MYSEASAVFACKLNVKAKNKAHGSSIFKRLSPIADEAFHHQQVLTS